MCKTCKKSLLDVENAILIRYYYCTAKTRALYESTDGPAGQPADYPPNSNGLRDVHRTVAKMTARVNWRPGPPIWKWVGSDPFPDPKRQSRTVANTTQGHPALTAPHEPILEVTMAGVEQTFKSDMDEMTYKTNFKLMNLLEVWYVNLTHQDPNTTID